jgi:hypothetical protein
MKTYVIRISEKHYQYLLKKAERISNSKAVKQLVKESGLNLTPRTILEAIIDNDIADYNRK